MVILSPDDTCRGLLDKAQSDLAKGCKIGWLVYPEKRLIEALTLDDGQFPGEDETCREGMSCPALRWLFEVYSVRFKRNYPSFVRKTA